MRTLPLLLLFSLMGASATAQDYTSYGFEREFPACLDQMQATLAYPLAWGNSPIQQFDLWRTEARHKVLDAMLLPPPPATDRQTELVAVEKRKRERRMGCWLMISMM